MSDFAQTVKQSREYKTALRQIERHRAERQQVKTNKAKPVSKKQPMKEKLAGAAED
jgi:hypothetical protein